ncbi:MAG: hypothetical protein AAF517_01720, partial [Planctomycetota bacterium]
QDESKWLALRELAREYLAFWVTPDTDPTERAKAEAVLAEDLPRPRPVPTDDFVSRLSTVRERPFILERSPRMNCVVEVVGKGQFVIQFFGRDVYFLCQRLLRMRDRGELDSVRVEANTVRWGIQLDWPKAEGEEPLPDESLPLLSRRGSVVAYDRREGGFRIHIERTPLRAYGRGAVGRIVLGVRLLDSIEVGDTLRFHLPKTLD